MRKFVSQLGLTLCCFAAALIATPINKKAYGQSVLESLYNDNFDKEFRISVQYHLMWSGNYNATLDGEIGQKTISGIRKFQSSIGLEPNGLLDENAILQLRRVSDEARTSSGYQMIFDEQSGTGIGIPTAYVNEGKPTSRGTRWQNSTKGRLEIETVRVAEYGKRLINVYEELKKKHGNAINYESKKENWFVLSGETKSKKFYVRFHESLGDIRGFSVTYNSDYSDVVDRIVVAMANSFQPWELKPIEPRPPSLAANVPPTLDVQPSAKTPDIVGVTPSENSSASQPNAPANPAVKSDPTSAAPQSGSQSTVSPEVVNPSSKINPATQLEIVSTGTGFAVENSWLMTNAHVVDGCKKVSAKSVGDSTRVIIDVANDLALLQFPPNSFQISLSFSGRQLALGESVVALGYPLQSLLAESLNVTVGNVSSLAGLQNDSRYLQMTAAVQPGNSGGPLLELSGGVIGVVSAKLDAINVASKTGDIPQSVNFAIKQNSAKAFIESNGVSFKVNSPEEVEKTVTKVTESARKAVFALECMK